MWSPTPTDRRGDLIYQGANYSQVEFPAQTQDLAVIDQVLGIAPATDSMTGKPLPPASQVTVAVVNGTGVANQAAATASALSALGFKTSGTSDSSPVGDVAETVVYYGSRSADAEAAAEKVTRSMSGAVVMAYDPAMVPSGAEVTVVTGTQFTVNTPASSGPTTTTTAPSSSAIASPSPASTGLEPWDPRACAPGAKVTAPVANLTY